MVNYHEIIATNHLGIIVDIDLNNYFEMKTAVFDKRAPFRLDPRRK